MAHIAVLLAEDFEDSELRKPLDALRDAGHEVSLLGETAGDTLKGKRGREEVVLDDAVEGHSPEEYDALLIPGGYSPDHLRLHEAAVAFTRDFAGTGKPVAAICHGPQLLISAGLVSDREMTSWPSVRVDLENAGAHWVDRSVVIDGPFITSRGPDDLEDFSAALLESLRDEQRFRQARDETSPERGAPAP